MKVVFPCPGSIVLLKQDLDTLKAFYNTSLITSKMNDIYKNSNSIVQVGNFNTRADALRFCNEYLKITTRDLTNCMVVK